VRHYLPYVLPALTAAIAARRFFVYDLTATSSRSFRASPALDRARRF